MRKSIFIFVCIVLVLGFWGCGEKEDDTRVVCSTERGDYHCYFPPIKVTSYVAVVDDEGNVIQVRKEEETCSQWEQGRQWLKERGWRISLYETDSGTIHITARKGDALEIETDWDNDSDIEALQELIQLIKDYGLAGKITVRGGIKGFIN